jgi:hypothetical protein
VIQVDWEAWAASDEPTRRLCGASGYLERAADLEIPRAIRIPAPAPEPEADPWRRTSRPTLPGLAAWLARHGGQK